MNRHIPEIIALVDSLRDPASDIGKRARDALLEDGGLAPETTEWGLMQAVARYERSVLESLVRADLSGRVGVVLARSVPIAPLRAIVLPLLRGAERLEVRPSSKQQSFARLIADCVSSVYIVDWPASECQHVIAYGSDSTVASIERNLPAETDFEGYSHGFGIALCLDEPTGEIGRRIAVDVAAFDQCGCLSPQCVVTVHNGAKLAEYIWDALESLGQRYPRSQASVAACQDVQWRGRIASLGGRIMRGSHCSVAYLRASRLVDSPGARRIAVVQVDSVAEATRLLDKVGKHLTCLGTTDPSDKSVVPTEGKPRIAPLGEMQDPPLDGPEDLRPPTRRVRRQ